MIKFFKSADNKYFAVKVKEQLNEGGIQKLIWLFDNAELVGPDKITGTFIGPRKEMITPWSTNAVEITQNMGITGIERIEEFSETRQDKAPFDPMLQALYNNPGQEIFTILKEPSPILFIDNITEYNKQEGLALNQDEISYLEGLSLKLKRKLTDSEIFGFSQVNSEHCRHKIFNGQFIINGKKKEKSLFQLIKETTKVNTNSVVSAYKDNCAFLKGPVIEHFAPETQDKPDYFVVKNTKSVISLKAETHNFPTTVEPFNGAATGTGGEIRDRIAGGKASFPIAGTAVYMTSYSRLEEGRSWEKNIPARDWLYHSPKEILIKASNGASDFGNKFGQPLICGSLFTFEHIENKKKFGFDKVIMMAGGIGFAKEKDSLKSSPEKGDKVVLLGGDNYRIGMGGGAVSSVATGEYTNAIELNAVQRSNPEMQKRVYNAVRALGEMDENPIISIHDHGAGGHLNCLSELVEATGGRIDMENLPVGDPTLSSKEIVGNESQERMGLVLKEKDAALLRRIAERERSPMYIIGEATGDHQFTFIDNRTKAKPIDLKLDDMFGNPPQTIMMDENVDEKYSHLEYDDNKIVEYTEQVIQLEAVACKDWLTNKVDRSVTGRIAKQQTAGEIQLPLNNLGVVALDYQGIKGIATSIGHAPASGLINPANGSILSIAEALTNIVWTPIEGGLKGISLSANWMWPCKNKGEDARLYDAVQASSEFAIALGINIPTGKDSLSMTQKYKDGDVVYAPGTVIISATGEAINLRNVVEPVLKPVNDSILLYIDFSKDQFCLGGSSFAQSLNKLGTGTPTVKDPAYFVKAFNTIQKLISENLILSGHDVSAGGLITTLLEMNFANTSGGMDIDLTSFGENSPVKILFSENPAIVIQVKQNGDATRILKENGISSVVIGKPSAERKVAIRHKKGSNSFDIDSYRDKWYRTSYLLDRLQSGEECSLKRFENYKKQPLHFSFPKKFAGLLKVYGIDPARKAKTGVKAAIIREKGVNGDREMAYMMYLAGFDVKDVHITDLISGRETLEDINFIVFVGGFSNSDVLGSAKGWAGAFLYNQKAKLALDNFYKRNDTLSLGVCNGCQLMVHLGLVTPDHDLQPKMLRNVSKKFESAFIEVEVPDNKSIMFGSLSGSKLGAWVAHGEGRFSLPYTEDKYNIALKFAYPEYPGNPNGSDHGIAGLCSNDGRHLVIMPHVERAIFPWNWPYYPEDRKNDEVSPWIEAFVNAREWVKGKK